MARTKDQSFVNRYLNQYQQNQKSAVSAGQQAASNAASSGVQQMNATGNIELPSLYDPTEDLYGLVLEQQKAQIKAQQAAAKAAQKAAKEAENAREQMIKDNIQNMRDVAKMSRDKKKRVQKIADNMASSETATLASAKKKTGILPNVMPGLTEASPYVSPYDSLGRPNLIGDGKFVPVLRRTNESTMNYTGVPARSVSKTAAVQEWESPYAGMTTKEKLAMREMLEDAASRGTEAEKLQVQKSLAQLEQDLSADEGYLRLKQKEINSTPVGERVAKYSAQGYQMDNLEEKDAKKIVSEYAENHPGALWEEYATANPITAEKVMNGDVGPLTFGLFGGKYKGQDVEEIYADYKKMSDAEKEEARNVSLLGVKAENGGAIEAGALSALPAFDTAADYAVRNTQEYLGLGDGLNPSDYMDAARDQSPVAYAGGNIGGNLALYAAGSAAARSIPALQRVGEAAAATPAAQAIQKIPVLGRLGTADAITGIYGDTLVDLALDTAPRLGNDILAYNQQQDVINQGLSAGKTMDEIIPSLEEYQGEYLTPGGIAADTLKGIGTNLAFNLGGELVPELLKAGGRNLQQALVPSLDPGADAARIAQGSVDEAAQAAYNEVTNGGVYNGSQAVDDARRAVASNPANGAGSGGNGGQSQFGGANGAGPDFRPGEAGAFAPGDIPPERVTNPDLETAFDLTSAERAAAANSGKDLRSSTTRNIKALYDDFDSGRISSADFSARAREIARAMVNEDDFTFTNMDDALREVRNVAKGQKLYVGDTELNELLSVSGAKSLSDFNRRFGTQLTRDRQYIALDQIDNELYWRYAGGTDTNPAEAFWSVVDGIKGNGAKSFDQAGYDEAVDYYRDLIERFDRYQREPGSAGVEYAAYADDIPSLYQPYGANSDLSINDLPESMLNSAVPSLYDGLPESIGAKKAAFGYTEVPSQANTVQSIDERFLRPEDIAAQGGQRQYTHQRISMAQQAEAARQIRQTEADDEIIQRIANKENGGGNVSWEDVSTLGAITRDMDRQLSMLDPKSQEYSDLMAKKLYASDVLQSGVSETGRALQTTQQFTLPERGIMQVQRTITDTADAMEKSHAKAFKQGREAVKEAVEKSTQQAEKAANDVFANSLAGRVSATVNQTPEQIDPEAKVFKDMVNELYRVAKESPLPKSVASANIPAADKIRAAFENRAGYEEVWNKAKEIVSNRFAGDNNALSQLDAYLKNIGDGGLYSADTVRSAVKESASSLGIDFKKLAKQYSTNKDAALRSLTDDIISKTGVSGQDAAELADRILVAYNQEMNRAIESNLKAALPELFGKTRATQKRAAIDRFVQLLNMGVYNDDTVKQLVASKWGVAPLSVEQATSITTILKEADKLPQGSKARYDLEMQAAAIAAESVNTSLLDKWNAWRYMAMLGNIRTNEKNIAATLPRAALPEPKSLFRR